MQSSTFALLMSRTITENMLYNIKIINIIFAYSKKKQYLCTVKDKTIKILLYLILVIIAGSLILKFIMYIIYCYQLVTYTI